MPETKRIGCASSRPSSPRSFLDHASASRQSYDGWRNADASDMALQHGSNTHVCTEAKAVCADVQAHHPG